MMHRLRYRVFTFQIPTWVDLKEKSEAEPSTGQSQSSTAQTSSSAQTSSTGQSQTSRAQTSSTGLFKEEN
ncbi:uncharacterized [Tachysurus ichikawai]